MGTEIFADCLSTSLDNPERVSQLLLKPPSRLRTSRTSITATSTYEFINSKAWTRIEGVAKSKMLVLTFSSRKILSEFKACIHSEWKISTSFLGCWDGLCEDVRSKSCRKPCRGDLNILEFLWSERMCCIWNFVFPFINLLLPFLKQAAILIKWAHKDFLSKRNGKKIEEKRKIYKPELCGIYCAICWASLSLTVVMGFLSLGCRSRAHMSLCISRCHTRTH